MIARRHTTTVASTAGTYTGLFLALCRTYPAYMTDKAPAPRFVLRLFAGHLDCLTRATADGAVLEPIDGSPASKRAFKRVVDAVKQNDGDGYSIASLAANSPNGPTSFVWVIRDEEDVYDDGNDEIDRIVMHIVSLDLSKAGKARPRKVIPSRRRRQKIIGFSGRDGDVEEFWLRQTIPWIGCQWPNLATPAQIAKVERLFAHTPVTSLQANTMLSAFDYACEVSQQFPFTAARRSIITTGVAAFILSDRRLRDSVRMWNKRTWEAETHIASGIANQAPYKKAQKFAEKMIEDIRSAGGEVFG